MYCETLVSLLGKAQQGSKGNTVNALVYLSSLGLGLGAPKKPEKPEKMLYFSGDPCVYTRQQPP